MFIIVISIQESTEEKKAYIKKVNENVTYCECVQVKHNILLKIIYHH